MPAYDEIVHLHSIEDLKKHQGLFDEVYQLYTKCFPLENEQQEQAAFEAIMEANKGAANSRESWVILKKEGKVVAAMDYHTLAGNASKQFDGSIHNIFVMVDEQHRNQGLFNVLEKESIKESRAYVAKVLGRTHPSLFMVAEQNNAFLMTAQECIDDYGAKIEQWFRRHIFQKAGYRLADTRYIQAALPGIGANEGLDLVVKSTGKLFDSLPGKALSDHCRRFMASHSFINPESGLVETDLNEPAVKQTLEEMASRRIIGLRQVDYERLGTFMNNDEFLKIPADQREIRLGELSQFKQAARDYFGQNIEHGLNLTDPTLLLPPSAAATNSTASGTSYHTSYGASPLASEAEKVAETAVKGGKTGLVIAAVTAAVGLGGFAALQGGKHSRRVRAERNGAGHIVPDQPRR